MRSSPFQPGHAADRTQVQCHSIQPVFPGQIMRQHHDHIHNLFDGVYKGIPVFSIVGNLNEDYEGAGICTSGTDTKCRWASAMSAFFRRCSCIRTA